MYLKTIVLQGDDTVEIKNKIWPLKYSTTLPFILLIRGRNCNPIPSKSEPGRLASRVIEGRSGTRWLWLERVFVGLGLASGRVGGHNHRKFL
jgi:hypothetical protein